MRGPAVEHVSDPRSPWFAEHGFRYRSVASLAPGRVLDVACGSGLGFAHLDRAALVVAGDRGAAALDEARRAPSSAKVLLCQLDVTALPFRSDSFDAVTCMETIEHVDLDRALVAELARVVSQEGVVVVSTPNVLVTGDARGRPRNPFHVREYNAAELEDILHECFREVEVRGQCATGRNSAFFAPSGPRDAALNAIAKVALRAGPAARAAVNTLGGGAIFPTLDRWQLTAPGPRTHALVAICRGPR